jgi:hypothetical protein
MPETRAQLFMRLVGMVGANRFQAISPLSGWPSRATLALTGGIADVALFVGPVGLSHRNRDTVERRFQNPLIAGVPVGEPAGKPIVIPAGTVPLLLGVWEEGSRPVLVAANARLREGNNARYSIFAPLEMLERAVGTGWEERTNTDGEELTAFWPELLPIYAQSVFTGVSLDAGEVSNLFDAAGVLEEPTEDSLERARKASLRLVRRKAFSKEVCQAYGNLCALCGLNFSLVVGAHIYPVTAPQSSDKIWNGLALCSNHHAAFDSHLIHVSPGTWTVRLHPKLQSGQGMNEACRNFVHTTYAQVRLPSEEVNRPRESMFTRRYDFYTTKYDWVI